MPEDPIRMQNYADIPTETDLLPDDEFSDDAFFSRNQNVAAYDYDVAVIGGGPAGYTAAIRAARGGAKTILFEKETLGGLHLNAGSVPIKTYLRSVEILRMIHGAESRGVVGTDGATLDISKALSYKNGIVANLTTDVARLLRSHRVRVEAGEAVLKSAHEIICARRVYTTSKIILCCGGAPYAPAIPGLNHPGALMDRDLFRTSEVPSRLLTLGGNAAGCEIAAVFATLGSNVMLVEENKRLLPDMDARVSDAIENALKDAGVKIYTGISVKEISDKDGHPFVITESGGVLCDKVVVAAGRAPDLRALGALSGEIAQRNGGVAVNAYLETNVPGVFAAGDITGFGNLTHAAYRMAEIAAENALGGNRACDLRAVPKAVYTTPEAAAVGLTEDEARGQYGDDLLVGYCPFSANTRAVLSGQTDGFVKVLADRRYGEILGVHIVGADAVEMIAEPAALMRMEVTVYEAADDIIHASPTFGEAFREAASDALDASIRLPKKMRGGYDSRSKI